MSKTEVRVIVCEFGFAWGLKSSQTRCFLLLFPRATRAASLSLLVVISVLKYPWKSLLSRHRSFNN